MRVFTPNLHPNIEKTEAKGMKKEIAKEQFLFLCKMKKGQWAIHRPLYSLFPYSLMRIHKPVLQSGRM